MARLPQPGGDTGNWGTILNEFLTQTHNADGTLKDGVIAESKLDTTLANKVNAASGGPITMGGDLSGTADNAQLVANSVGTAEISNGSVTEAKLEATVQTKLNTAAPVTSVAGKTGAVTLAESDIANLSTDLAAKAADSAVVHNTGNETLAGTKTFSSSPIVPTPTLGTQASNKSYVDSVASAGAPDATSSAKGIVQLAGDLSGTASAPTVPGLASRVSTSLVGAANGVASLDATGKVPSAQLPAQSVADATTGSKGIIQLAGDLGGTATAPTVPGLTGKATDTAVVHNTGNETVAGVKTFSSSPVVPTPTTNTQAANKSYVDSVASSGAPDATSSTKGIVQLAGDLGGTAAAPTVPGLAGKADTTHTHAQSDVTGLTATLSAKASTATTVTGSTSVSGGGDLSANRTLSLVNDVASPGSSYYYGTNAGGTKGWYNLPGGASVGFEYIFLDDMAGATDDDKLTAAISLQQSTAGMPPIVLAARNHSFDQTRTLYSGLKLIGQSPGPKNLEQSPNYVTSRITLGASLSSGTASWWVTPGGNLFDIYMADFAVQGSAGSSKHQFIDVTTGSLYACQFHSLSFNFMRSVFGRKDRKCLVTQVVFSGHWTANNLWDTQFFLGGADCQLWMGGYLNIGPSSSAAQTGTYADNDYQILFDNLTKTDVGYIFTSSLNGWRGIKVTGTSGHGLRFFGGSYEGYKPSNDNLAAPGTVIRLEGGSGAFFGPSIGQAMQSPDAAEGGPVHMTGGEWSFYSPNFYRSPMAETQPCIYHTGGRLLVQGATRHEGETWTNRPRYYTTSSGPNSTEDSFYCPDMSMIPA